MILFQRLGDFHGYRLTGYPVTYEAHQGVEQQNGAGNDDQSAGQCGLGIAICHWLGKNKRLLTSGGIFRSSSGEHDQGPCLQTSPPCWAAALTIDELM